MRFEFDGAKVKELVAASRAATAWKLTFGQRVALFGTFDYVDGEEEKGTPGLWLVHDDGVYLMSNAADGQAKTAGGELPHVHAHGYGDGVHVPGDDYAEFLEVDPGTPCGEAREGTTLVVKMGEDSFALELHHQKARGRRG